MIAYAAAYLASAVTFFGLDMLWLGLVARDFYRRGYGDLLLEQPLYAPAAGFYVFYIVGIVFFAVMPALQAGSWLTALGYGALLGLLCYGTYDMTNLATLKGWPVSVAMADMAWGTALTGTAALVGFLVARHLA